MCPYSDTDEVGFDLSEFADNVVKSVLNSCRGGDG